MSAKVDVPCCVCSTPVSIPESSIDGHVSKDGVTFWKRDANDTLTWIRFYCAPCNGNPRYLLNPDPFPPRSVP